MLVFLAETAFPPASNNENNKLAYKNIAEKLWGFHKRSCASKTWYCGESALNSESSCPLIVCKRKMIYAHSVCTQFNALIILHQPQRSGRGSKGASTPTLWHRLQVVNCMGAATTRTGEQLDNTHEKMPSRLGLLALLAGPCPPCARVAPLRNASAWSWPRSATSAPPAPPALRGATSTASGACGPPPRARVRRTRWRRRAAWRGWD